jgi:hypothetical protein
MEEKDIMRKLIKKERHEKKPQEKPQKTNPNSVQIMKK